MNINDEVEVTLTEAGMDQREAYWRSLRPSARAMPKREAVWRTQLWCVMQELGPATYMGGPNLIVNNELRVEAK